MAISSNPYCQLRDHKVCHRALACGELKWVTKQKHHIVIRCRQMFGPAAIQFLRIKNAARYVQAISALVRVPAYCSVTPDLETMLLMMK